MRVFSSIMNNNKAKRAINLPPEKEKLKIFLDLYEAYKLAKPKANEFDMTKLENDKLDRENKQLQKDLIECQKKKPMDE